MKRLSVLNAPKQFSFNSKGFIKGTSFCITEYQLKTGENLKLLEFRQKRPKIDRTPKFTVTESSLDLFQTVEEDLDLDQWIEATAAQLELTVDHFIEEFLTAEVMHQIYLDKLREI